MQSCDLHIHSKRLTTAGPYNKSSIPIGVRLNKRQLILGLVVLAALIALGFYAQHRHPINWHEVVQQFAESRWSYFGLGIAGIYLAYILRATRWAYLLRHHKKVSPLSLVASQVIGFTAVALIGRVADPVRPYLTAKKTGLTVANQLAVYIVERLFDFGTMAVFFSVAMIIIFQDQSASSSLIVQSTHSGFLAKIRRPSRRAIRRTGPHPLRRHLPRPRAHLRNRRRRPHGENPRPRL